MKGAAAVRLKVLVLGLRGRIYEDGNSEKNVAKGITLVILRAHTLFSISYEGFNIYWKNHLNELIKVP